MPRPRRASISASRRKEGAMARPRWLPAAAGLAVVALGLAASGTSQAQGALEEVPFDRKLLASTGAPSDRFGSTIAVSGDVLVATAPNANVDGRSFAGAAYV